MAFLCSLGIYEKWINFYRLISLLLLLNFQSLVIMLAGPGGRAV
jgi:hypothetical protein